MVYPTSIACTNLLRLVSSVWHAGCEYESSWTLCLYVAARTVEPHVMSWGSHTGDYSGTNILSVGRQGALCMDAL